MSLYPIHELRRKFQEQVALGAGLAGSLVIWGTQSADRPTVPHWIGLSTTSMVPLYSQPEQRIGDNPDSTLGDGAELLFDTVEQYEVVFSIQVFSASSVGADGQASEYLHRVRSYLARENTLYEFSKIQAAIIDRGPILHLPTVLNSKYESRANMDVRVRLSSGDSETTTFIQYVNESVTLDD